jgi:hypothetical protein
MSSKNPLLWDAANNRYIGTCSRALNELGRTAANGGPAGLPPDADETASMASTATTGSADSLNTVATDVILDTNASVGTSASVDTTNTDVDLSGGGNNVAPTVPASWQDRWYNADMNATKAYVPKKRFDSINKINFTAQKNKNKYGVEYDRTLPDLTDY